MSNKRRRTNGWRMVRVGSDLYHIDYGPWMWTVDAAVTKRQAETFIRWAIAQERGSK